MTWEDLPRWQRLAAFWLALALAIAFSVRSGGADAWIVLGNALIAGRLLFSLGDRKSDTPESSVPGRSAFGSPRQ